MKKKVFKVWAPNCHTVDLKILNRKFPQPIPMKKSGNEYFSVLVPGVKARDQYFFILDQIKERPDPKSRFQPKGVHGPSAVTAPQSFKWTDGKWKGLPFEDLIFYELHTGTFTPEGTFRAVIEKIPYLKKLGITCIEIMPVAQFPGKRNWGYDGVNLFAVQNSYGGPDELKRLVNACHRAGLAVCLDVVYNHFGPEGNYLRDFGPYFTKKYHTPWGEAVNFDGPESREVRRFIIENALYWVTEFHFDALRLDAIHSIFDRSKKHILQEVKERVEAQAKKLKRNIYVIAESDLNDSRIIRPKRQKGYGLDGQWSDDFHHAVHAYLTGERNGYYQDFGHLADIAKALQSGFVYDGKRSRFRKKRHGNKVSDLNPRKLVVCIQNHDQVGNRAFGEMIGSLIPFEKQKLAAVLLLLSPNTPLIFMGQEYGEQAPFQYFIDHEDPDLIRAVREGRKREFLSFGWKSIPDPASVKTFSASKLKWKLNQKRHKEMLGFYQDLIAFRKKHLNHAVLEKVKFDDRKKTLHWEFRTGSRQLVSVSISFSNKK